MIYNKEGSRKMKKILSIILSVALVASLVPSAFAADVDARQPDVYVNGKIVEFKDQAPYITDEGRTLVPARGVFEAMGSVVVWDAENYVVTVSNENQKKDITLKIGDTNMTVKTADEESTKILDVPAQLMNNRTMIPLRAVSEALESVVVWNPGDYSVYISMSQKISIDQFPSFFPGTGNSGNKDDEPETEEPVQEPEIKDEDKMIISLYTDAEDVKVGDVIDVYVAIENFDENLGLTAVNITFLYDKDKLEYLVEEGSLLNPDGSEAKASLYVENDEYSKGTKMAYLISNAMKLTKTKTNVFKAKFKVIDTKDVQIQIGNEKLEGVGYETSVMILESTGVNKVYEGNLLNIDMTPVIVK